MNPRLPYLLIGVTPLVIVLVMSAVSRTFRSRYWENVTEWLPAMEIGGVLLALDGILSEHIGFWVFNPQRFAPERYFGLPLAEYVFFFVGAPFGVQLLRATTLRIWGYVKRPALVKIVWLSIAASFFVSGLLLHDHLRTLYVSVVAAVAILLALTTSWFYWRGMQASIAVGVVAFLDVDMVMNGMHDFQHNPTMITGWMLPFGVPAEDVCYIIFVLLLMLCVPDAYRAVMRQPHLPRG